MAAGRSPIVEPRVETLISEAHSAKRLSATSSSESAVMNSDISFLCVGTPSLRNGKLDLGHIEPVCRDIGQVLKKKNAFHLVVLRSTVLPGTAETIVVPALEQASGKKMGNDFGVCVNPEFLREGSAIRDFERAPFTLVGETDTRAGDLLLSAYAHLQAPVHRVQPDEASMVKYASNMFHAIKVAFGNEVGALCQSLGVDGQTVMGIFCEDRELNISPRYLRPGFGFGGSCLPKDLRAMAYLGKERDLSLPLVSSVLTSNDAHIQRVVDMVLDMGKPRVALLGLSFKIGSDDLRESPFVRLAEALIGKGVPLRIYDPDVALDGVFGRNKAYIDEHLPHVGQLMARDFQDVVGASDVVVIGKLIPEVQLLPDLIRVDQVAIDLAGMAALEKALRPWSSTSAPSRLAASAAQP
jgi:GDP-mannose 6-dehydrogenase